MAKTQTIDTAYINVASIKAEYAPFNKLAAFEQGYNDYLSGNLQEFIGVAGQAYDRGYEAGMLVTRQAQWVQDNVGTN